MCYPAVLSGSQNSCQLNMRRISIVCNNEYAISIILLLYYIYVFIFIYLTVILRGRARYELIYITNEAEGRVGYYQLISSKYEKNNCFSKFSSNSLDFFG